MAVPAVKRILIVDDEPGIRMSLAEYLRDFDMDVSSAEQADEALAMITQRRFDVAIIDVRLPGASGDDFILRAFQISPHTRFLVYTGSANYRLSDELVRIGLRPDHVFLKPQPNLERLVEAIYKLD
jgi:DNA-binding NtrC family response regulator